MTVSGEAHRGLKAEAIVFFSIIPACDLDASLSAGFDHRLLHNRSETNASFVTRCPAFRGSCIV